MHCSAMIRNTRHTRRIETDPPGIPTRQVSKIRVHPPREAERRSTAFPTRSPPARLSVAETRKQWLVLSLIGLANRST